MKKNDETYQSIYWGVHALIDRFIFETLRGGSGPLVTLVKQQPTRFNFWNSEIKAVNCCTGISLDGEISCHANETTHNLFWEGICLRKCWQMVLVSSTCVGWLVIWYRSVRYALVVVVRKKHLGQTCRAFLLPTPSPLSQWKIKFDFNWKSILIFLFFVQMQKKTDPGEKGPL